ncbi:unnamed protein product [Rodentolepis nana]|uniref:Ig-like domain-containing protein n=1 Tax=Rodentolepis nana TaxID=102285 RepID=A0A0R3THQ1_RODNA|nr:unnamed protein product [Rodentolepis nana]
MDDEPKSLSLPMNPLADTDVVCCTPPEQMRSLALETIKQINGSKSSLMGHTWKGSLVLETINVNYPGHQLQVFTTINVNSPGDQWLQVFTDGSYIENQANVVADVYTELLSFYTAAGHNRGH